MFDLKESDLPELERLAKSGYGWIARDWNEQVYAYTAKPFKNTTTWVGGAKCEKIIGLGINSQIGVRWSDPEPLNIAAAIEQIKAQRSATEIPVNGKSLTWNDRINQMTIDEKAEFFIWAWIHKNECLFVAIDGGRFIERQTAAEHNKTLLTGPYGGNR